MGYKIKIIKKDIISSMQIVKYFFIQFIKSLSHLQEGIGQNTQIILKNKKKIIIKNKLQNTHKKIIK